MQCPSFSPISHISRSFVCTWAYLFIYNKKEHNISRNCQSLNLKNI
jgi:hypothetical protein